MLDDEVVFLGFSSGKQTPQVPHRPVTGIVLHVEKQSAPGTGCRMMFRKASTSVVHIGRRSGLEADTTHSQSRDHEQDSAMFRCAVVSRKHARIAFSDSGHAYLIDLASHHGTFVRKPGDNFSKMIKPETSTMLADGDIVTFGKSVGKGDETVLPIVVRIELLHAGSNPGPSDISSSPFKPLVVPSASLHLFTPERTIVKTSPSGRYGVHTSSSPSSSSDDSYSSHSPVVYSDIEEIPPPTNMKPSTSQNKTGVDRKSTEGEDKDSNKDGSDNSGSANQGSLGQALNVLRRFLPPSQPPLSQVSSFFFGPESKAPSPSPVCLTPPFDIMHPHSSLSQTSGRFQKNQTPISIHSEPTTDNNQDESRASSPMDLGSPSSAREDDVDDGPPELVAAIVPRMSPPPVSTLPPIALPPIEVAEEVHIPPLAPERMNIPLVNSPDGVASNSRRSPVSSPGLYRYLTPPDIVPLHYVAPPYMGDRYDYPFCPDEPLHPREFVLNNNLFSGSSSASTRVNDRVKKVEGSIESLKAEIAKLNAHRRKYKARFNSNVQVISEKLGEFDDRLLEVNAEYIVLTNQVERIQEVDIAEITTHLEELQDNVDEAADEREDAAMEVEASTKEKGDIKATLDELGQAVAELKAFRDDMKIQLDEQLAQMKSLHDTAMAHLNVQEAQRWETRALLQQCQEIQVQIQAQQANVANQVRLDCQATAERCFTMPLVHSHSLPQTPVLTSLKRKRDDTDENEEVGVERENESESEIVKVGDCDIEMNGEPVVATTSASASGSSSGYVIDGDAPGAEGERSSADDADDVVVGAHDAKVYISDSPPPRKRTKRFAKVVAQTATAVTVGAVVTWSALAYS